MHKAIYTVCVAMFLLPACGGGNEANAPHPTDQVAWGQELYGKHCASCHGDQGAGTGKAPPVVGVGKGALPLDPPPAARFRKTQFHTAKDVFDFVKANMPAGKGGSLTDEQYAAILAFDLKANGVDLGGKQVDATSASSFVIHP
jgi:mono/diheme cytochrome c family protein